jgi:S-DNA-T family DNA segregation ATPase FtsK/SpoIIIE
MFDRRPRRDLAACGLLVAGLAVAASLFSYDPRESASADLLGAPGGYVAEALVDGLGIAVYAFLCVWFFLVVLVFARRRQLLWSLRLAGWVLLVPATAVLADGLRPAWYGEPVTGSGGSLGASLALWLEEIVTSTGRSAILAATFVLATLLIANIPLFRGARRLVPTSRAAARSGMRGMRRMRGLWGRLRVFRPRMQTASFSPPIRRRIPSVVRSSGSGASGRKETIPIRHHEQHGKTSEPVSESGAPTVQKSHAPPPPIHRAPPMAEEPSFADYELPPMSLLEEPQPFPYDEHDQRLLDRAALLEKTFTDFGLNVHVVGINTGPVITQYEVALETGLRVHKVTRLADDLALNLKVPSVRMVAPIPGKNTVGVEIPNEHRAIVRLKELLLASGGRGNGRATSFTAKIPLFLGQDTEGRPLIYDLAEMPHLLIAGRTGTGKSVCMNAIILSILMTRRPDEVKMVMIDPKMLELSEYGRIPHLMHPVVKDMKKAEAILSWAVDKMEERYDVLSRARVRGIAGYNELPYDEILNRVKPADEEERRRIPEKMPYIVIFVDEMNDLLMMMKKEVEGHIIRLAQKSRAAGIHLVVATQKPTVDVITGLIKSNLPARICFQVSSRSDSRVVLDEMGADKLLGKGDMLFLQPGTSTLVRAQGTYLSDEEISRVAEFLECEPCYVQELIQLQTSGKEGGNSFLETLRARDELYEAAIEVILREGRGSVSLLQRALGIGYGRAARLIDFMAEDGIVGGYNGSNAREVLYTPDQWDEMKQASSGSSLAH